MLARPELRVAISVRLAGSSLAVAGALVAVATPFHPNVLGVDLAAVVRTTGAWAAIHVALAVAATACLPGALGIVALHGDRWGRSGRRVLAATTIGCVSMAAVMYAEAAAFPLLATGAPRLLSGLLSADSAMVDNPLAVVIALLVTLFPFGFAALGVLAARDHSLRRPGLVLAGSSMAFAVFEGVFFPVLGVASSVAFGLALAWWGVVLWRAQPEAAVG